jgi:hypothetical protein
MTHKLGCPNATRPVAETVKRRQADASPGDAAAALRSPALKHIESEVVS